VELVRLARAGIVVDDLQRESVVEDRGLAGQGHDAGIRALLDPVGVRLEADEPQHHQGAAIQPYAAAPVGGLRVVGIVLKLAPDQPRVGDGGGGVLAHLDDFRVRGPLVARGLVLGEHRGEARISEARHLVAGVVSAVLLAEIEGRVLVEALVVLAVSPGRFRPGQVAASLNAQAEGEHEEGGEEELYGFHDRPFVYGFGGGVRAVLAPCPARASPVPGLAGRGEEVQNRLRFRGLCNSMDWLRSRSRAPCGPDGTPAHTSTNDCAALAPLEIP